jgi:molybdenum cofactor biosynthesis enzyme MoaA
VNQLIRPVIIDNNWSTAKLVPSADLVERIRAVYPTLSKLEDPHSDTTRSWKVDQTWKGKIGFISSMSDHFCGECSRLRVGAEGGVKVSSSFLVSLLLMSSSFVILIVVVDS